MLACVDALPCREQGKDVHAVPAPCGEVEKKYLMWVQRFVKTPCLITDNLTERRDNGGEADFGNVPLSRAARYEFKDILCYKVESVGVESNLMWVYSRKGRIVIFFVLFSTFTVKCSILLEQLINPSRAQI